MTIAVIVSTYNRPDALAAVLEAFRTQRDRAFELIVADDGSTGETARVVDAFRGRADFPVVHVWHEDRGFRAGAIRNRAIAATSADYVIFTDGDCLVLPGFVGEHRRLAEKGWFVAGSRILLSEAFTRRILAEPLSLPDAKASAWFRAFVRRDINRLVPLVPLPLPGWGRKLSRNRWEGVMTCNLASWREDLLAINGFDEAYHGWGLEDSDLVIRLLRRGIGRKSARFAAPVFHLSHRANDRTQLEENRRRLEEVLNSNRIRASSGVSQYL